MNKPIKFWNWSKEAIGQSRVLTLDGVIAEESWFGDEVTPSLFSEELNAGSGDVVVWINSPGGDCFAASRIYTMLKDYDGKVIVKIDGLAASAASVIAMAGDEILMSPTAMMMIHNPWTTAYGDSKDMHKTAALLDEVKESIVNAYELKTRLSRAKISRLMEDETWMNANKAQEFGFADAILFEAGREATATNSYTYSAAKAIQGLVNKLKESEPAEAGTPIAEFYARLDKIKH